MRTLREPLLTLGAALDACRHLWQPDPFLCDASPWSSSEPQLHAALMGLSPDQVELLQDPKLSLEWLQRIIPHPIQPLTAWEPKHWRAERPISQPPMAAGIPGRKWQQINYFSDLIKPLPPLSTNVDWCSGKGYLATLLESDHSLQASHCLEIDANLCSQGRERAEYFELSTHFHCCDVLQPIKTELLDIGARHTALHACGELHRSMLQQAAPCAEQILLSPCCYHLFSEKADNRLSQSAQELPLVFDRQTLRIPLLETVTGGARVRRLRAIELTWRHAYEIWRKAHTGDQTYRPLPSTPKAIFNQDPSEFFQWAAEQHGLSAPAPCQLDAYLDAGRERFLLSERLGIVRQGIKGFIEYMLLLDLGCYLEEQGFDVNILEFCPKTISPRNFAIIGVRRIKKPH